MTRERLVAFLDGWLPWIVLALFACILALAIATVTREDGRRAGAPCPGPQCRTKCEPPLGLASRFTPPTPTLPPCVLPKGPA